MKTLVHYTKRPYIYALILTIGMTILHTIVVTSSIQKYLFSAALLYLLLLFELIGTKYFVVHKSKQLSLVKGDKKHRRAHIVHHLILPSLLFLSIVSFMIVSAQLNVIALIMIATFVLYSILFTNVRSYYENDNKLEHRTANIYDVVCIISAFLLIYSLLVLIVNSQLSFVISGLLISEIMIVLGYLTLSRYQLVNNKGLTILVGMLVVYLNVFFFLTNLHVTLMLQTISATFIYYYFVVIVSHINDKSFTWKVLIEYLAIFVLLFVLMILGKF